MYFVSSLICLDNEAMHNDNDLNDFIKRAAEIDGPYQYCVAQENLWKLKQIVWKNAGISLKTIALKEYMGSR